MKLKRYNSDISTHETYTGSYLHDFKNSPMYNFFTGDTLSEENISPEVVALLSQSEGIRLSLVISHCDEDMAWMEQFIDYDIQNVTIYSKCNKTIDGYSPPGSKVIQLHYMTSDLLKEEDATDNHLVIFLKASRSNAHHIGMHYRSLKDMIRIAMVNGFSCGYEHGEGIYFHNTPKLRTFLSMSYKGSNIKSPYANMGDWLDIIGIKLPSPITPVCYGGNFAVKASQIYPRRAVLKRMKDSLRRSDNIEEGHFAERTWAGLLSPPLNYNQMEALQSIPTVVSNEKVAFVGHLRMRV